MTELSWRRLLAWSKTTGDGSRSDLDFTPQASVWDEAASDSGNQASGGTVRRIWKIGSSPRVAHTDCPMKAPSATTGAKIAR